MNLKEVLIVNPMAPVEAWVRTDVGGKRRKFKNWYEFLAWYDPRHHGEMNMPPNSQEKFTDALVDTLTDSPRKRFVKTAPGRSDEAAPKRAGPSGVRRNHAVLMDGREFGSLFKAFSSLGWPDDSKFQRFRKELKAKRELTYEGHKFKIKED